MTKAIWTDERCPRCGGVVERTTGEAERTMAPAFAYSLDDLYRVRVTVWVWACTSCEWCAEEGCEGDFTGSDTISRRGGGDR